MAYVLAIYARENGEGMMFPEDEASAQDDTEADSDTAKKTPSLKLIK